ncbi:uncharacterized protein Dwil_GK27248 [Drosophila willistoni]|uniref:Uncharacterized protein n=1 Tax=Drosophila willistoni TaxID=7260 RepID=A0A0Q9WQS2_DROWI|nr:uncharacterized protein Dwil_GK27248 [Drosophila willistoni]
MLPKIWLICAIYLSFCYGQPQLNLPTPQPEVFYNGYTPNVATTPAQVRADRDRDQRYGPPYADEGGGGAGGNSDDGLDDFRYGQTYDERMRLGYAYPTPQQNFSDSPFSGDRDRQLQGQVQGENRYSNHNYGPLAGTYNDDERFNQYNNNNNNNNYNNNPNVEFVGGNNRFTNPYRPNQDRFNLNQGFLDRQRYQQDRRYQQELEKLRTFLVEADQTGSQECTANVAAQWNFETNVNDFTQSEAVS